MDEEIKTSSSKMDAYDWCQRKYRIKVIEEIPSGIVAPHLTIGSVSHQQIHKFWNEFKLDLDNYIYDINDYFKKVVRRVKIDDVESFATFQTYYSNFLNFQIRRIEAYIKKYGKDYKMINDLFFPILSEKYGVVEISNNVKFAFIVDALFENFKGNVLIDWKTDKECNESSFLRHIPQLNRYSACLPKIGYSNKEIGVFFLKESLFFHHKKTFEYSLENEVLGFVRKLQTSSFNKVPKSQKWKCEICEYYPDICVGAK